MTPPKQITAGDVAIAIIEMIRKEGEGLVGLDAVLRLEAQAHLTHILEVWHRQLPLGAYQGACRDSPFERARRDPLFAAMVKQFYQLMRQGEGQWTPTEIREAAMVAQVLVERELPLRFVLEPAATDAGRPENPDGQPGHEGGEGEGQ